MEAETVAILGEAEREERLGIFLSVKLREDIAGPVLLFTGRWEDTTYKDFPSNHSLLVMHKFMSLIHAGRSLCEFLPHVRSGFSPYHPSFITVYFFVNSSVLHSFSVTASLPLSYLHTL